MSAALVLTPVRLASIFVAAAVDFFAYAFKA